MPASSMQFWRDPALGNRGVDLLVARDTTHRYESHFHEEYVVSVFGSGSQRHRVGRRQSVATAGSLVLIRPGEPHTGEPAVVGGNWSHRAFYPDADSLHGIANALFSGSDVGYLDFPANPLLDDVRANGQIAAYHRAVCDESVDPADRQQAFVEAMELLLLRYARVGRSPRKPGGERSALNAAIVCMHDRFGDPDLSVSDLAQAAGLSQFYFMRSFLNATGMTAHSYLVQLRLNAARGRLAAGAQAAAVAVECGFFDQSHLIRHFRRVYGVTPGRYRRRGPGDIGSTVAQAIAVAGANGE